MSIRLPSVKFILAMAAAGIMVSVVAALPASGQDAANSALPDDAESLAALRAKIVADLAEARSRDDGTALLALKNRLVDVDRKLITDGKPETIDRFLDSAADAANQLVSQLDFDRARQLRREMLQLSETKFGAKHWRSTDARFQLEHVGTVEALSPTDRQRLRDATNLAATAMKNRSGKELAESRSKMDLALPVLRQILGADHPFLATHLNNAALLASNHADFASADRLYREALEIQERALGEDHPAIALSLYNLGVKALQTGDFRRAESLLARSLEMRQRSLGPGHPDVLMSMSRLSAVYFSLGEFSAAEPLMRQFSESALSRFGPNHETRAQSLNNLGALYSEIGDLAAAESNYSQALEIARAVFGPRHANYASVLGNVAHVRHRMGQLPKAEEGYLEVLQIEQEVFGEDGPECVNTLINLGGLCLDRAEPQRASTYFEKSLQISRKHFGETNPRTASCLANLAIVQAMMGHFAPAEDLIRRSIEITAATLGEQHPDYAMRLRYRARFSFQQGHLEQAEIFNREALDLTRQHLDATAIVLTERQQLAMASNVRDRLDSYLSCLVQQADRDGPAYAAVLSWKGATLMRQRALRLLAEDPQLEDLFARLQQVTRQWSALIRAPAPPDKADLRRQQLASLMERKARLETELAQRNPGAAIDGIRPTIEQLQSSLPPDSALIDFLEISRSTPPKEPTGKIEFTRELLAFVVKADAPPEMVPLGPVEPLAQAVETWRQSHGMSPAAREAGTLLRKSLWEPLLPAMGQVKTVLVSPDGVICRLPLAALPGKAPGSYLLEDHTIVVVPVPQLVPAFAAREIPRQADKAGLKELLLMGGIDYSHRPDDKPVAARPVQRRQSRFDVRAVADGMQWPALADTVGEVAFIKDLYQRLYDVPPDAIVDRRQELATEEAFRELAPQCQLVHLATHGFFAPPEKASALSNQAAQDGSASPGSSLTAGRQAVQGFSPGLLSGLVFAGANHPPEIPVHLADIDRLPDDGILTAEEIAYLPLGRVRLAVLSACETGLGEVAGGEGVLGLQRSFQIAGARSTITSLWQVNDLVTRRLMEQFYRNYLEKELSAAESLREAQLWLLRNPDQLRGDQRVRTSAPGEVEKTPPFFWAAFQISGDWK